MGQVPRELVPSRSVVHFFGAELRHWRMVRGLSQDELGRLTHDSGSTIGKVEKALRRPTQRRPSDPGSAEDADVDVEPASEDLGLGWSPTLSATVETVSRLWRADVERRAVVVNAAWVAATFAAPTRDWLLRRVEPAPSRSDGRQVGRAEVDVLWSMCQTFTDLDHQLGGGHARTTLSHYLTTAVLPMLNGSYDEQTGRQLMAAAARLCNLGGFMAFDCGRQGLAQRYYIQALRLTQASGDRSLGAHILADMSMQAQYLRDAREALALALAGQRTAQDCGSFATLARCYAMEARAHALLNAPAACGQAMNRAEHALDSARDDEPRWIRFFTPTQLAAEFLYAANELGHRGEAQRFAPAVLATSQDMRRRLALATVALASSHLAHNRETDSGADIDQACLVLRQAIPVTASLSSPRTLDILNSIRVRLRPHATRPTVMALEEEMGALVGAST
jgi:hypothetical protein